MMRQPTPDDWERIEAALGLSEPDAARRAVMLETLGHVLGEVLSSPAPRAFFEPGPYPHSEAPEYRRAHRALKHQAEKACSLLDDWDWRKEELQAIITQIDDVAPEEYRGGRPANRQLRAAIYKLGELYTAWTGRERALSRDVNGNPSGPFFAFVSASLRAFIPEFLKGDEALFLNIRRAPKKVRPTI